MTARPLLFGFLFSAISFAQDAPRAIQVTEPPKGLKLEGQDRAISSTGQFSITGGEPGDRGNIALLAEQAKDELLILTGERLLTTDKKYEWKIPVAVVLHGKSGDPMPSRTIAMQILVSEVGFNVRMDVHLSRGIEHERFKFATTTSLIYERSLRNRPANESDTRFLVPPWLVDGLREATAWRLNQSDRRLYEALFKTGGLFKIDDLFSTDARHFDDMDGAMRAAFRVSAGSLVMALLEQPQGKEGFRNFLTEVAAYEGEMPALLRKHFPELNLSETSLSKWWALQLANIGGQNLATDILTVGQTETALTEGLRLNFRTPEGIIQQKEIAAWPEVAPLPEPERVKAVQLAQDSLVRLSYRCFPSYRPILAEYQIALNSIAKNQTKDLAAKLTDLGERRATMTAKALRARDYMDWFEITRARETSGAFDDYMRLKERLKANPRRRTDDVSRYLDRMDAIFSRKGDPEVQAPGLQSPGLNEIPELPPLPLPDN
ncbi:MAG: hypothetical protein V4584_11280 [Verrucomicrobiota bacterium]